MNNNNSSNKKLINYKTHKYSFTFAFKQQLLQAWQPKPTLKCSITIYLLIGILFFGLGALIVYFSNQINTVEYLNYQNDCKILNQDCKITINVPITLRNPVYFYIMIDGFYQNHRRYVKSVSYTQLRGQNLNINDLSSCEPVITNQQMKKTLNLRNGSLIASEPATPCGLIAKTFFDDEFLLDNYEIITKGIAWPDDLKYRFKNWPNKSEMENKQWIDMTNERFINWMRISAFNNFKKLWGIINKDIPSGSITFTIKNNWDVSQFNGKKSIILSEVNILGGKNLILGYAHIAVGILSLLIAIVFIIIKLKRPKGLVNKKLNEEDKKIE